MKRSALTPVVVFLCLLLIACTANAQKIELLQQGKRVSIRGLSVVNDSVAWLSGNRGYVATTSDGGKNWSWLQVKGFETSDFRDIEAFSAKEAIIMSSGTPALILKTTDGGTNWLVKYKNIDTAWFFDAMDFSNKQHGYVLGDPIKNKFVLMETTDGGESWRMFNNPPDALPGEGAFAASGTCLRVKDNDINIATGGAVSRLISYSPGKSWRYINIPVLHGKPSQGSFSFATGKNSGITVGGDYAHDKRADSTAAVYPAKATLPAFIISNGPAGYQSCVEFIGADTFVSTGTSGSNITEDGGKTWAKIDNMSYNVCARAKHGRLVLLAGDRGKIAVLKR